MIRFATTVVVLLLAAVAAVVSYRHAYEVVVLNGEAGFTAYLVPLTIDGAIFASSMVLLDAARRRLPVPKLARWTLALGILATLAANVAHGWAHGPVGAIVAAWPAVALVLSYELLMGMIRRGAVPVSGTPDIEGVTADTLERVEMTPSAEPGTAGVDSIIVEKDHDWEQEADRLIASLFGDQVHPTVVPARVPAGAVGAPAPAGIGSPIGEKDHLGSTLVEPVQVHLTAVPPQVTASTLSEDLREADYDAEAEAQRSGVPESDALYPLALSHFLADVTVGEVPSVRTIKSQMSVGTDRARKLQVYLGQLVTAAS